MTGKGKMPRPIRLILTALAATLAFTSASAIAADQSFTLLGNSGYQLIIPSTFIPSHNVDLLFHFHGDPTVVRDQAKAANLNVLIVTANLGALSSAYQTPFQNDNTLFQQLMDAAQTTARTQPSIPDDMTWNNLAVSSFSAGYAGVREVLKQPAYFNRISSLLLADSLYASYTSTTDLTPLDSQMTNFRTFVQQAAAGNKTFIFAHSLVATTGYCDTKTCADDLAASAALTFSPYSATGLGGIHYYRKAVKGNATLYGATEDTGTGHLLFLQDISQWYDDLPLNHVPEPSLTVSIALISLRRNRRRQRRSA